uniref:Uncharacterized protein n=1 Tax=Salix viminalis TaxID=40686 RepID=A0A6N2LJF2_SALVM
MQVLICYLNKAPAPVDEVILLTQLLLFQSLNLELLLMLQMGFQANAVIPSRFRLRELNNGGDQYHEKLMARPRRRRCWVKKMNGGVKRCLRLSRSRKLTFKALSVILMPSPNSRIAKVYAHVIDRIKMMDDLSLYPNIIFSTHWGLPVLSHPHPSVKTSLHTSLTCI